MNNVNKPINYIENKLFLLDQRKLPAEEIFVEISDVEETYLAIKDMIVRGAPCIGFTGIFGMALGLKNSSVLNEVEIKEMADYLISARPTAVNLKFEIDYIVNNLIDCNDQKEDVLKRVVDYGNKQLEESEVRNRRMAIIAENELDKTLGKKTYNILTHCNTGFLACGSIGTALGVVQNLGEKGKISNVWVDETRPYLQGARLTAYELSKLGINHKVVVEGSASYLMANGLVDAIFTGADRVVSNGDTANKIGTSNLAIIAKHYNIPFYIVAPISTFDLESATGNNIDIELRDEKEIHEVQGIQITPKNSKAFNPSFDITKGELITGIICENGMASGDYKVTLSEVQKSC